MKTLLTFAVLCLSFTLFGQTVYDFESGIQGWTTDNATHTHLNHPSRASTWRLRTQTGGPTPVILGGTWYGTPNVGHLGAERSWIVSPVLYADATTVSINFDSYTSNEGGFVYDVERVQASVNGGPFQSLHNYLLPLHRHADRTFRNFTFSISTAVGDEVRFRFLYDTGDNIAAISDIRGWYVDNVTITGASECTLVADIAMPEHVLYYGYDPLSCIDLAASSTGGQGDITYTWSIEGEEIATGESATICADGPECIIVEVTAVDGNGCSSVATMLVEVVDVRCGNNGNNPKVLVCHNAGESNSRTLCIAASAVAAHLAHGDVLGDCNAAPPCDQAIVQDYHEAQQSAAQAQERTGPVGSAAYYVPTLDPSTIAVEDRRVYLYPNPAATMTNVKLHRAIEGQVAIEIYNQLGQVVLTTTQEVNSGETIELNLAALEAGVYELKFTLGDNGFYTEQLVVVK